MGVLLFHNHPFPSFPISLTCSLLPHRHVFWGGNFYKNSKILKLDIFLGRDLCYFLLFLVMILFFLFFLGRNRISFFFSLNLTFFLDESVFSFFFSWHLSFINSQPWTCSIGIFTYIIGSSKLKQLIGQGFWDIL